MRTAIFALALAGAVSPACADTWASREGDCGEWRGFWRVERNQDNILAGRIDYVHVGGECTAPTGERISAEVHAVIAGRDFFATRPGVCNYHGIVQDDRVRGQALCAGSSPGTFALRLGVDEQRFAPTVGDFLNALQGALSSGQAQDDFLDDPSTHRRNEYWRLFGR